MQYSHCASLLTRVCLPPCGPHMHSVCLLTCVYLPPCGPHMHSIGCALHRVVLIAFAACLHANLPQPCGFDLHPRCPPAHLTICRKVRAQMGHWEICQTQRAQRQTCPLPLDRQAGSCPGRGKLRPPTQRQSGSWLRRRKGGRQARARQAGFCLGCGLMPVAVPPMCRRTARQVVLKMHCLRLAPNTAPIKVLP